MTGFLADVLGTLLDPIVLIVAIVIGATATRWDVILICSVIAAVVTAALFLMIDKQMVLALYHSTLLTCAYLIGASAVKGVRWLWAKSKPTFST
jgi:hypothetical protein